MNSKLRPQKTAGAARVTASMLVIALWLLMTAAACSSRAQYALPTGNGSVRTGLERFIRDHAEEYRGKRAVLITNHSGVDRRLRGNIRLLRERGIIITTVLSPEHGLYGYENDFDSRTWYADDSARLVVYNLHNLSDDSISFLLRSADAVIYDIQDMGMRCYTYISNLKWVMDSLRGSRTELVVLDRPNPIGFLGIDGPPLEKAFTTRFIGAYPAPFIYGMTAGEAADFYRGEYAPDLRLRVVRMSGYDRDMLYSETGLPWVPPSPNLPSYESSILYTAMVYMEGIDISLGRGTTKPFEYLGAPWIDPESFCRRLSDLGLKNFRFRPVRFMPTFSLHRNRTCGGVQVFYTGGKFSPTETAYRIIGLIKELYPRTRWTGHGRHYSIDALAGTDRMRKAIESGKTYEDFIGEFKAPLRQYKAKMRRYLLY